jgi:hypothetical protein
MSYVGANAERLDDLRAAAGAAGDELSQRRGRIAGLFAEADEPDVVGPALSAVEADLGAAGCEIGAAAVVAAADAAAGGQTGWRASLGIVDDVALDLFFVNDLYRAFGGRDINTGQPVGTGERVASGVFLIPFAKLAKAAKLLKLGDDAVETGATAAARASGRAAVQNAEEVRTALSALRRGRSSDPNIRVVDSVTELDALLDELTHHATAVDTGLQWPMRQLSDGTRIARRPGSASGGPTLDVTLPDHTRWKVHVDPWPPQ